MATIDLSNYSTSLHQASSASFTDGNVFFDPNTGTGEVSFGHAGDYATYTPSADTTASQSIQAIATGNKFVGTGINFGALGFRPGMNVTASGFANGSNSGTHTIVSISTTTTPYDTISVDTTLTDEAAGGDERIVGASTTNSLIELDGLKLEALYAFENQERRYDEVLRGTDRFTRGTFKFGGAYDFVFGRVPKTDTDRKLFRGSGWRELTGTTVNEIWFGPKGLGSILSDSVPYYQTSKYADVTGTDMFDFTKLGNLDEAFQVYGDATHGNFDNTLSSHYFSVRTYGQNYGRISTGTTLGIAELGGYSSGAALNESSHLTTSTTDHPFASVAPDDTIALTSQSVAGTGANTLRLETSGATDWTALGFGVGSKVVITGATTNNGTFTITAIGDDLATNDEITVTEAVTTEAATGSETINNAQIAPWTGMSLEKFGTTQTKTGFTQADGDFFWVLNNTAPGTLNECIAYLDALATIDATINVGTPSLNGKAYDVWYYYQPSGEITPVVGTADGWHSGQTGTQGLFIDALAGADKLRVSFIDDGGNTKTYPVYTSVTVEIGQSAIDDTLAWFHIFTAASFNTASPVDYLDAQDVAVKGPADNSSPFITGANTFFDFEHDYSTDGDVNVVILCEGDGGVTQAKTTQTLSNSALSLSAEPAVENNA